MNYLISRVLKNAYGIEVKNVKQVQGGWSANAHFIMAKERDYFLKIFDKHRNTAQSWIGRIDYYIPIVLWLYHNTPFHDELIAPIFTDDGSYKFENEDYVFILYPYIKGTTLADKKLSANQQRCLAKTVAKLHQYGKEVPSHMVNDVEDFDVSFCNELLAIIEKHENNNPLLDNALASYKNNMTAKIKTLQSYAKKLIKCDLHYTLCHTDLHGWNLIQADQLILVDWEGLKLAPVEADLFAITEGFFFDYTFHLFLETYRTVHPDYAINQDAMNFYRLRRRLEDINEFAKSILYDNLSQEKANIYFKHLIKECSMLQ